MAGRSILIVEDEPLIAMMLEDFVESLGHTPAGTADTVDGALQSVSRGGFDLVILDVNLGGDECWPVADALSERQIPFILATGGHVTPPPSDHVNVPTLSKPFTLDSVREVLDGLILTERGIS
jgi:CheY-like chemotaxis protein